MRTDETPGSEQITQWLARSGHGDTSARERLLRLLIPELQRVASSLLRRERPDHTLEPGALVNEAYLRLFAGQRLTWQNRAHFLAIAAETMRRILIDHARARRTSKRGGEQQRVDLAEAALPDAGAAREELLGLDLALHRLEVAHPRAARVVELRFFGGLGEEEVAEVLGVSPITAKRDWKFARAWLLAQLRGD